MEVEGISTIEPGTVVDGRAVARVRGPAAWWSSRRSQHDPGEGWSIGRQRGAATRLRQRPHAHRRAPPGATVRFTSSFPDTRRASTVAAGNPLLRPADVAFQDRAAARNASGSAARIRA